MRIVMTHFLKIAFWMSLSAGAIRADEPSVISTPAQNAANSDSTVTQALGFGAMGLGVLGGIGAMVADRSSGSKSSTTAQQKTPDKKLDSVISLAGSGESSDGKSLKPQGALGGAVERSRHVEGRKTLAHASVVAPKKSLSTKKLSKAGNAVLAAQRLKNSGKGLSEKK